MKCSESLQQKIEALAAGELAGIVARGVERHAHRCAGCSARLAGARALQGGLRGLAEETPPEGLRMRVFEKLAEVEPAVPERNGATQPSTLTTSPSPASGRGENGADGAALSSRRARRRLVLQAGAALGFCLVMAAILLPAFFQARGKGREIKAEGSAARQSYTQDYDESFQSAATPQAQVGGGVYLQGHSAGEANLAYNSQSGGQWAAEPPASGGALPARGPISDTPTRTPAPTANITPAAADRYLIRNATLSIEVKDARAAHATLLTAVKGSRGYLSNLQETVDALGARTITMQVRVPATLFDSSMQRLSSLGKVMEKHVTAEDVTEEYVDTESTLRNLNRTEARLLEHLGRTGRLRDTLLVEKELTRVRAEIEQREGRLRFLSHRVSFSTIDVTLQEAAKAQPAVPPQSYSTGKEASDATRSLVEFLRSVWTTVIWIGIWAVVWAPLTLAGWWVGRWVWRAWVEAGASADR